MLRRLPLILIILLLACSFEQLPNKSKDNSTITDNSSGGNTGGDTGDGGNTGGGNPTPGDNSSGETDPGIGNDNASIKFSIVAGTSSGLYYSMDNATTWTKASMPVGSTAIWLSVENLGNKVVLAGSGEDMALGIIDNPGHGILKSIDGGVTWRRTGMRQGQWNDILYVGNGIVLAGSNTSNIGGVWKSTDYGETWKKNVDNGKIYNYYIAANPVNANGIADGFVQAFAKVDNNTVMVAKNMPVAGVRGNLFHLSNDNGSTWYRIPDEYIDGNSASQILVHRSGRVSVALNSYAGITYSTSNGRYWDANHVTRYSFGAIAQSKKTDTIIAGAHNMDTLGLGGSVGVPMHGGLWRSASDGSYGSYVQIYPKYLWKSVLGLDDGSFLAGCLEADLTIAEFKCRGLYKSTNDGVNWNKLNNVMNSLVIFNMAYTTE